VRFRVIATTIAVLISTLVTPLASASAQSAQSGSCFAIDRSPDWVAKENAHPGSKTWRNRVFSGWAGDGKLPRQVPLHPRFISQPIPIRGWFDRVSVTCGDQVGLHLSGRGKRVKVELYRTGFYQGLGARLIWSTITSPVPYRSQINITADKAHTISTSWPTTVELKITDALPPGQYLAKLSDGWKANFVPLTIRDDQSKAPILFVESALTAEAYNHWGGSSLYRGSNGSNQTRSRVVSFDRPYDGTGASQYLIHEFGLVKLAEKLGLDLAYITDIDLNNDPEQVRRHRSIIFGGHAEYWTTPMRNALDLARAIGVNIVNFGANAAYWRTRLENNGRSVAVWRDTSDPYSNDHIMQTSRWRDGIIPRPESLLFGVQYAGLGVKSSYRIPNAKIWPFIGTGLTENHLIKDVVGKEVDSPDAGPGPAVQFLTSATVTIKKKKIRVGMSYYTTGMKSGVLDVSTDGWVCAIDNVCNWGHMPPATSTAVSAITAEILKALTIGPLGIAHPAKLDIAARK